MKEPQAIIEDCNRRLRLMDSEQCSLDLRRKAITQLRDRMVRELLQPPLEGWDVT